ncbi:pirin family protein [Castellaniella ginsengisoli]|jgi:redox-sensitive bicupin YhaK (pirin superfamily)|uniref:Pirin family protein n=1 Tax=Castellaniella ginsengisoli TaxID=546114 RepID=A0AB39EE12_9BURK
MSHRAITRILPAQPTQDGAGVRLLRALGHQRQYRMDPFLMLDAFSSDDPDDYIAGFPPHPHRGFETVTYIVDGHMRHRDHLGNEGDLKAGGVQWMMAGRGIIHEEMPQQENGLLRGFQIWLNLPAADKMQPAHYRDIPAGAITRAELPEGGFIKLIAGTIPWATCPLQGPGEANAATQPLIADIRVMPGQFVDIPVPATHQALLYVFEGRLAAGGQAVEAGHTVWFGDQGETVHIAAAPGAEDGARVLLLAGKPLNEPIAQYGPFVMNTPEEIEQALRDYRDGVLAA